MRHELWRAILGARNDIDKLVASAIGDYPAQPPPRAVTVRPPPQAPGGPQLVRAASRATTATGTATAAAATAPVAGVEHDTLRRLQQDVQARIEVLRRALAPEPGGEQALLALVLYFDERVMETLPDYLVTSWPLLQTRLTGRKTGGSDFFHLIDRLLNAEPQPELVFEVYYFCLAGGFQGQYADDLASIERYKQHLCARIPVPEPQRQPREPAAAASPTPIKIPALYYAAAVAVILVLAFALTVWSNQ